ncbi:MAG: hypothetical protein ACLTXK_08775 [Megamonas funiformis]|uniref:hypothetical protein n=1 Tax=Megamonas funiformis TaxID=437897 RepID=UPI0039948553
MVTLFYTKIHSEFFIFLGVALHYTIHHIQRKKIDDILALNIRDFMPMAMSFGAGKYCTIEQKRILIS